MFRFNQFLLGLACGAVHLALSVAAADAADNLGVLGAPPKWQVLEKYQETITHDEFVRLLQTVYCTHGLSERLISVSPDSARILKRRNPDTYFTLRFAANDAAAAQVPRLWHRARSLGATTPERPLAGLRIALDPGHLGGSWAKMEERWFQVGDALPVTEGDLTLRVSRLLAPRLRQLGASVSFVRQSTEPVTPLRPDDFKELARKILIKNGVPQPRADFLNPDDPEKERTIRWQSEILFYRFSEIRRRAVRVNTR
ncbi:MAG TPA: hypothetical protein VGG94_07795, partial [Chthoniobacterales bacterium]